MRRLRMIWQHESCMGTERCNFDHLGFRPSFRETLPKEVGTRTSKPPPGHVPRTCRTNQPTLLLLLRMRRESPSSNVVTTTTRRRGSTASSSPPKGQPSEEGASRAG